jgi:hypothetical protein
MVDKIDKPEPVSPYYIHSAAEADKDGKGQQQEQRSSDEYSGLHAAPGWQQAYASASSRRYMKLKQGDIVRAWFRTTTMQRGVALAEVDLALRDGRLLKNAHIILSRDDYWSLKRFQPGQDIPLNMVIKSPEIEISVPSLRPQPAQPPQPLARQAAVVAKEKKPFPKEYRTYLIYAAIGVVFLVVLIYLFLR